MFELYQRYEEIHFVDLDDNYVKVMLAISKNNDNFDLFEFLCFSQ